MAILLQNHTIGIGESSIILTKKCIKFQRVSKQDVNEYEHI
jgi:hypothetical protein